MKTAHRISTLSLSLALVQTLALAPAAHAKPGSCEAFKTMAHGQATQPDGFKTQALVILKDGQRAYEWNEPETTPATPHVMWSISKMVTAMITGAAAQKGLLSLDDPLAKYVPPLPTQAPEYVKRYNGIRIHHLMSFTSGIVWQESGNENVKTTSIGHMLYSLGYRDVVSYYLGQQIYDVEPGSTFVYSSGNAILQMAALRKILGKQYDSAPWDLLFDPLGIKSARFEQDASGNFIAGSYLYLSARDMATLGQLYLDDGVHAGNRLLPEGFVKRAQTVAAPIHGHVKTDADVDTIGLWSETGFWLNHSIRGLKRPFPLLPEDAVVSAGMNGQLLIVIPSEKLVIARTGQDPDYWYKIDEFGSLAIDCSKGEAK